MKMMEAEWTPLQERVAHRFDDFIAEYWAPASFAERREILDVMEFVGELLARLEEGRPEAEKVATP
jgi:hypothetical protein